MRPCVQPLPILGASPAAATPPRPVAGASVQLPASAASPFGQEITLSPIGTPGVPKPISTFTDSNMIQPSPDNAFFTYLGFGRLRYDGPPALFSIDGAVTVAELDFDSTLVIVINTTVLFGTGSIGKAGVVSLEVASVVRKLNTNDVVSLAIVPDPNASPTDAMSVLTLQMRVVAAGHVP